MSRAYHFNGTEAEFKAGLAAARASKERESDLEFQRELKEAEARGEALLEDRLRERQTEGVLVFDI